MTRAWVSHTFACARALPGLLAALLPIPLDTARAETVSPFAWVAGNAFVAGVRAAAVPTGAPRLPEAPRPRLLSINLCADQLLLEYAPADQIVALSDLAVEPYASRDLARARRFPLVDGSAEAAIARSPDIVVAGEYSSRHTVAALRDAGLRVEILPLARSLDTVFANIESIHRWLGRGAAGVAETERLRQRLQRLVSTIDADTTHAAGALTLDANGFTVGRHTLDHELLTRAGWRNLAVEAGVEQYGKLPLETIVRLDPAALIESPYRPGSWSRGQALVEHPALQQRGIDPERIVLPSRDTICGGPWSVDVVERLAAARRAHREK